MTKEQATEKAIEWDNLLTESDNEEANGCHGAAERLLNEALNIERELERAGYRCSDLVRH